MLVAAVALASCDNGINPDSPLGQHFQSVEDRIDTRMDSLQAQVNSLAEAAILPDGEMKCIEGMVITEAGAMGANGLLCGIDLHLSDKVIGPDWETMLDAVVEENAALLSCIRDDVCKVWMKAWWEGR